jgi:hypothetical protein
MGLRRDFLSFVEILCRDMFQSLTALRASGLCARPQKPESPSRRRSSPGLFRGAAKRQKADVVRAVLEDKFIGINTFF